MRFYLTFLIITLSSAAFSQTADSANFEWPNGETLAISLSYDDALNSQLDNAVPVLDRHGFKASFYIIPASDVVGQRMKEWRALAKNGHELGNHSIFHPCSKNEGHDWVPDYKNMDEYTIARITEELMLANTFLKAIDGKNERTYTPPCGSLITREGNYLPEVANLFVAIKGQGMTNGFSTLWAPAEVTGEDLIEYVKLQEKEGSVKLVNILFHGIGGDHLSVSTEAHSQLITYLSENNEKYWIDSYINIMRYVNSNAQ